MKKRYYFPIAISVVLIITNPTYKDFKNHIPVKNEQYIQNRIKLRNYFFASTYEDNSSKETYSSLTSYKTGYLGILGNFIKIGESETVEDLSSDTIKADSALRDTTRKKQ